MHLGRSLLIICATLNALVAALASSAAEGAACIDYSDYLRVTGGVAIPDFAVSAATDSRWAYVAARDGGLVVVDVANASEPAVAATIDTEGRVFGVAVRDGFAFAAAGSQGLLIFDITNPRAPLLVSTLDTPGYAFDVVLEGSMAVVADRGSGLAIIDVSNPSSPVFAAAVDTPELATAVVIQDDYAYVADGDSGLQVVDLVHPEAPVVVASAPTSYFAWDIAIRESHVYLTGSGITIVDVTNPRSPFVVKQIRDNSNTIALDGSTAFVLRVCDSQLVLFDLSEPTAPKERARVGVGGGWSATVHGGRAYVSASVEGFQIIDISNPIAPGPIASITLGEDHFVHAVGLNQNIAYAVGGGGMNLVDISAPEAPELLTRVEEIAVFGVPAFDGHLAYVPTYDGLEILDITNPRAPVRAGGLAMEAIDDVAIAGSRALAVVGHARLDVIDIVDSASPALTASLEFGTPIWDVAAIGDVAYVTAVEKSLIIVVDVSVPSVPVTIGSVSLPARPTQIAVSGHYAFVLGVWSDFDLLILDLKDPTAPALIAQLEIPGRADDLQVVQDIAYVASGGGFEIVDVFRPEAPRIIGGAQTPSRVWSVAAGDDFVCVVDFRSGLQVFPAQCPRSDPANESSSTEAPGFTMRVGASRPNPSRAGDDLVWLPFELRSRERVRLSIFDAAGRLVRVLLDETREGGDHLVPWDGRTAAATPVAAGHYFYRLDAGGISAGGKLVRLK